MSTAVPNLSSSSAVSFFPLKPPPLHDANGGTRPSPAKTDRQRRDNPRLLRDHRLSFLPSFHSFQPLLFLIPSRPVTWARKHAQYFPISSSDVTSAAIGSFRSRGASVSRFSIEIESADARKSRLVNYWPGRRTFGYRFAMLFPRAVYPVRR